MGTTAYPVPTGAVVVSPSGNDNAAGTLGSPKRTLAGALAAVRANGTIVLRAGTYHESVTIPDALSGITIQSYPHEAVWMDGSRAVTGWQLGGHGWVVHTWTARFDHSVPGTYLRSDYPMAGWPDQVQFDGAQMAQVGSVAGMRSGTFMVDYASNTIEVGNNPSGHQIRASDLGRAITVSAVNVTLRGFGIRNYADTVNSAGVVYVARSGVSLVNMMVTDASVEGIATYKSNALLDHVSVIRAGMLGVGGYLSNGMTLRNSAITQTNFQRFNKAPSSAGIKVVTSSNVTVSNNVFAQSYDTHAVWFDISCIGLTVVGNSVSGMGNSPSVQIELSASGIIANNAITGGTMGVYVLDSNNLQIYNNNLSGNSSGSVYLMQDARRASQAGMSNPQCPWIISNIFVANNAFGYNGGPYGFQFYAVDHATHIPASSMAITLQGNLFHIKSGTTDSMVGWGNSSGGLTSYNSPAALNAALRVSWSNLQGNTTSSSQIFDYASKSTAAYPLPSAVASAIGQPAGTKHIGTFN